MIALVISLAVFGYTVQCTLCTLCTLYRCKFSKVILYIQHLYTVYGFQPDDSALFEAALVNLYTRGQHAILSPDETFSSKVTNPLPPLPPPPGEFSLQIFCQPARCPHKCPRPMSPTFCREATVEMTQKANFREE